MEEILFLGLCILSMIKDCLGKECYNYKKIPSRMDCEGGCCGEDYEQHCCNMTLQIAGTVIGCVIVLSIIIAVTYYCLRKRARARGTTFFGAVIGRFGQRSNITAIRTAQTGNHRSHNHQSQLPANMSMMPPGYLSTQPGAPPGQMYPPYPPQPNPPPMHPLGPTAPMPPPYSVNPPPYVPGKEPPPPPAYEVVGHMNPGYKYDYNDHLPPPTS